jgi:hypothetical protein
MNIFHQNVHDPGKLTGTAQRINYVGQEIAGTIHSFDTKSRFALIQSGNDFHLINTLLIEQTNACEKSGVDLMEFAAEINYDGKSVEGKRIYDVLSKTLPVKWSGSNIIVFNDVIIQEPYTENDIKNGKAGEVARVKKILELIRQQFKEGL